MSWNQIIELLKLGEGQTVEFKKNLANSLDLARDLVAFSNTNGGYIVLGIDDKNGHLVGETVTKEWILAVSRAKCEPKINPIVDEIDKGGKKVLLITIHEGNSKPYYAENKCYIRDGVITRLALIDEEKSLSDSNKTIQQTLNRRQQEALDYVHEHGSITNMIYRDLFNISHKTAHLELAEMLKQNLIVTNGKGRSTSYILPTVQ